MWKELDDFLKRNASALKLNTEDYNFDSPETLTKRIKKSNKELNLDKQRHLVLKYKQFTQLNGNRPPSFTLPDKRKENKLLSHVHKARSKNISPNQYTGEYSESMEAYDWAKKMMNLFDFEDILLGGYSIFEIPEICQKIRDEFRYTLVDEFQDLNSVQMAIINKLQENRGWVTVVGDERQSIYGFRGATPKNNFYSFINTFVHPGLHKASFDGDQILSDKNVAVIKAENPSLGRANISNNEVEFDFIHISDSDENSAESVLSNSIKRENHNNDHSQRNELEPQNMQSLIVNYRSDASIVELANIIIKESKTDDDLILKLRTDLHSSGTGLKNSDDAISIWSFKDHTSESKKIAEKIKELIDLCGYKPGDIAILLRNFKFGGRKITKFIQSSLTENGIGFELRGGRSIFEFQKWSLLISFLRCIIDPNDNAAYKKVLKYIVHGLGDVMITKIEYTGVLFNEGGYYDEQASDKIEFDKRIEKSIKTQVISKKLGEKLEIFLEELKRLRFQFEKISLNEFFFEASRTLSQLTTKLGSVKEKSTENGKYDGANLNNKDKYVGMGNIQSKDQDDSSDDEGDGGGDLISREFMESVLSGFSDIIYAPKIDSSHHLTKESPETSKISQNDKTFDFISEEKPVLVDYITLSDDDDFEMLKPHKNSECKSDKKDEIRYEFSEDGCSSISLDSSSLASKAAISSLISYLSTVSDNSVKSKDKNKVIISTIHQSKGLEWPVVFLPIFVDGLIPTMPRIDPFAGKVQNPKFNSYNVRNGSNNVGHNDEHFEEEMKLAYVGITRAKHMLIISKSKQLYEFGLDADITKEGYDLYDMHGGASSSGFKISRFIPDRLKTGGKISETHFLSYEKF
ncbi:DNA helicase II [Smittium mucronatum]|uniref:DNA 3'-5' helicase n=1 Tax=Smittium mucronatum TaxID=133383 RepID=A0A1R0GLN4_9FUNG|nr:DNA helicase II [Smittium mucronatum]